MASLRVRKRKDGSSYTAVLYMLNGKQTSSSFNDHAEAVRFQELANKTNMNGKGTRAGCQNHVRNRRADVS